MGVGGSWIDGIATQLLDLLRTNYFPMLKLTPNLIMLGRF